MFTGTEDNSISLSDAQPMTKQFQTLFPGWVKGTYVSMASLNSLLAQSNVVGARVYFAMTPLLTLTTVMVGVDCNGNDLTNGVILDKGVTCPPNCATSSPLTNF